MEIICIFLILFLTAGLSLIPTTNRGFAPLTTVLGTAVNFIIAIDVTLKASTGAQVAAIEGWVSCDSFGALLLLLVSFVGLTAAIFSSGYIGKAVDLDDPARIRRYYARYNLFLVSMTAVPVLSQITLVWIAIELTTLLSVFLVSFPNTSEAIEAAWKYAVLTCMGAALALFGILILYWGMTLAGGGPFTWLGLVAAAPKMPPALLQTGFLFILIGFGTKAGLVPLHTWLPDAHSQAPSPICALLSGVETSTALYAIMKVISAVQAVPGGSSSNKWIVILGLLSACFAAFLLIQVKEYKRLFAFSTIEHMGIILVAVGLGGSGAYFGATYQILGHAVTKSFCFFAAGAALRIAGVRDIVTVRGLIRESPSVGGALLLGALAISGAPPFAIFLSELAILKAGISNGQYLAVGLLALFIVIAFCGIMFHISRMVFGTPAVQSERPALPTSYIASLGLAAIPVCLFGLYIPRPLLDLLHLAATSLGR
jgi:hydrogenase-4 component F